MLKPQKFKFIQQKRTLGWWALALSLVGPLATVVLFVGGNFFAEAWGLGWEFYLQCIGFMCWFPAIPLFLTVLSVKKERFNQPAMYAAIIQFLYFLSLVAIRVLLI